MGERQINELAIQRAGKRLIRSAGSCLINTIYLPGQTCRRCKGTRFLAAGDVCRTCRSYEPYDAADLLGTLIYACKGEESGRLMRGYKEGNAQDSEAVLLLLLLALSHNNCARKAVGSAFTHWASVPSLQHFDREHPLHRIVHQMPGLPPSQVTVRASASGKAADYNEARRLNAGHFDVVSAIPAKSHVLVIEDTWTSGGHAQSVAAALKGAGAEKASILSIGRWLDMDDPETRRVCLDALRFRPYDYTACPWLDKPCRPPAQIGKAEQSRLLSPGRNGPVQVSQGVPLAEPPSPPPMRCSLHGVQLDQAGRCDACTRLMERSAEQPDAKPAPKKKPWWQFW
ncbi:MAG: hypothetical protein QG671_2415 [Actinomycetota bacterium]|nr:hypothetical protein [Actinomycetota bacterium]